MNKILLFVFIIPIVVVALLTTLNFSVKLSSHYQAPGEKEASVSDTTKGIFDCIFQGTSSPYSCFDKLGYLHDDDQLITFNLVVAVGMNLLYPLVLGFYWLYRNSRARLVGTTNGLLLGFFGGIVFAILYIYSPAPHVLYLPDWGGIILLLPALYSLIYIPVLIVLYAVQYTIRLNKGQKIGTTNSTKVVY